MTQVSDGFHSTGLVLNTESQIGDVTPNRLVGVL